MMFYEEFVLFGDKNSLTNYTGILCFESLVFAELVRHIIF